MPADTHFGHELDDSLVEASPEDLDPTGRFIRVFFGQTHTERILSGHRFAIYTAIGVVRWSPMETLSIIASSISIVAAVASTAAAWRSVKAATSITTPGATQGSESVMQTAAGNGNVQVGGSASLDHR